MVDPAVFTLLKEKGQERSGRWRDALAKGEFLKECKARGRRRANGGEHALLRGIRSTTAQTIQRRKKMQGKETGRRERDDVLGVWPKTGM